MQVLEREQRYATAEEQAVLSQYTSWGGASEVFDHSLSSWSGERERLHELVDDTTYRQLRETSLTAYYTAPDVTSAMWEVLDSAGLRSGTVLEPGSGIGGFIGSSPGDVNMVGVEADPVAATISHHLYPNETIRHERFERTPFIDGGFNGVIGNVPFERVTLNDPTHNAAGHSIHDHFIIKSLNLTQPGGYVALITSSQTADSKTSAARADMIDRADLISAVRLPSQAFKDSTGAEVVADLLVFRVREDGKEPSALSNQFLRTDVWDLGEGQEYRVNAAFQSRRDHILGEVSLKSGRFGPTLNVSGTAEGLGERLRDVARRDVAAAAEQGLGYSADVVARAEELVTVVERSTGLPGEIRYSGDDRSGVPQFDQYSAGFGWSAVEFRGFNAARRREWKELIGLRDAVVDLREAYTAGIAPSIRAAQAHLNDSYDSYVERYGAINRFEQPVAVKPTKKQQEDTFRELATQWRIDNGESSTAELPAELEAQLREQAGEPVIREPKPQPHLAKIVEDPLFPQVLALEIFDDETQQAQKTQFFSSNPARRAREITYCDDIHDAVSVSLDRTNAIDVTLIAELMDESTGWVEREIENTGLAFRDPDAPERFIRSQLYLSGAVFTKLADARTLAVTDERFQRNVDALEQILPERVDSGIEIRPGASWIPLEVYGQYVSERLGLRPDQFSITNEDDTWYVRVKPGVWNYAGEEDLKFGLVAKPHPRGVAYNFTASGAASFARNQAVACNRNDGVAITAPQMFESVLNLSAKTMQRSKAWLEEHPEMGSTHAEASAFAGRKAQEMREDFAKWVVSDPQRWSGLVDRYNDAFNSMVATTYDGSHRTMPGLGESFSPYPYQLNAVERMVNSPSTLLSHVVGAGKTGTMLMGAAELKRLGRIQQPWLVVPNHIASQVTSEAIQWYPNAKVLSAAGINTPEGRRNFVAQTTADDWDFVIVPQSVFERIPMSIETQSNYIEKQKAELEQAKFRARAAADGDEKAPSVRDITRSITNLDAKLEKLLARERDIGLEFENTPCDYLIVDEAHLYKNLMRTSRVQDLNCAGSGRASDLDMKLNYLRDVKPADSPVATFATGTPISNNLAEIWVMMHMLRPELTTTHNLASVNEFASTFTDQVDSVEMTASGADLRKVTRTAAFINVGELAKLSSMVLDSVTRDQIPAQLPVLKSDGRNTIVEFEVEQEVKDFISDLGWRGEYNWEADPAGRAVKNIQMGAKVDNPLKISSDGRAVSLHAELANLSIDGPGARVTAVTDNIIETWRDTRDNVYTSPDGTEHPQRGGLQIVFCDRGTPKKNQAFSVYQGMKDELVAAGMDPERIRFIHDWDHDRDALFSDCRNGYVDVLIGSTEKLGTGANIQTRATALHHVDVPWRPADLTQREGRILRQGNQNTQVEIFNYIAAGTFDAVQWQTVARKAKFIEQFLSADSALRRVDSLEESGAQAAALNKAIATGDVRHIELIELESQERDLLSREAEWKANRESFRSQRLSDTAEIENRTAQQKLIEAALPAATRWIESDNRTWHNPATGTAFADRQEAADYLGTQVMDVFSGRNVLSKPLITIGGVEFETRYDVPSSAAVIFPKNGDRSMQREQMVRLRADDLYNDRGNDASRNAGILSRVENRVKSLPEDRVRNAVALESAKARLEKLENQSGSEFSQAAELASVSARRAALERALTLASSSEEAQRLTRERDHRNTVNGRDSGWSLRLNPTLDYAEKVEGLTQPEVIYDQKRGELDARFNAGLIEASELGSQLAELNASRYGAHLAVVAEDDHTLTPVSITPDQPATSLLDRLGMSTSTITVAGQSSTPHAGESAVPREEQTPNRGPEL